MDGPRSASGGGASSSDGNAGKGKAKAALDEVVKRDVIRDQEPAGVGPPVLDEPSLDSKPAPRSASPEAEDVSATMRRIATVSNRAARVLGTLSNKRALSLEAGSIYGAAIGLPQIAQSFSWQRIYTLLAIRSYILLFVNICLQFSLLSFLGQGHIMDRLAGRMSLCQFGTNLQDCPESPWCAGPGGTTFTKTRLYSWNQWSLRVYVRDAMLAIFPEMEEQIMTEIDPGEYGVENNYCRIVCCFIFVMSVINELRRVVDLWRIIWLVPTRKESWVRYVPHSEFSDEAYVPRSQRGDVGPMYDFKLLRLVRFRVSGMTTTWKCINLVAVFLPKVILWWAVLYEGLPFFDGDCELG